MVARSRTLLAFVLMGIGLATTARGAEPKRIELTQAGRKVVYYQLGERRFREMAPESIARAPANTKVCVQAKLAALAGKQLQLYNAALSEITFALAPTATVTANPGANLLLCGQLHKEDGRSVFRVEAVGLLPADLEIFAKRWQTLGADKQAVPEDYFQLAWWISSCEKVATGLSAAEFDRYRSSAKQALSEALKREAAAVAKGNDETLRAVIKRYRGLVDASAGSVLQGHADWHVGACRQLLHAHAAAVKELEAGNKLAPKERRRLLASLYLFMGRMRQRYLADKKGAAKVFLEGASYSPDDPGLGQELRALGYMRFERDWVTKEEAKRLEHQRAEAVQAAAAKKAEQEAAKARAKAREQLLAGEGVEKVTTVVDALLSKPDQANLLELGTMLHTLPSDVARYALWQAAALPDKNQVLDLANAALHASAEEVRADALDLLAARGEEEDTPMVIVHLRREKSTRIVLHAVHSLCRIPGPAGVDALILVIENSAVPVAGRKLAAELLARETKQSYGLDAFGWKQWWKKNRDTHKRPEL